jgi:methylglutamate dehydrogenase subunit B
MRKEGRAVGVKIPCPHCGERPFTEFSFGGELREAPTSGSADADEDFRRVYLRTNAPSVQVERWFHAYGCRRWLTLRRDVGMNRVHGLA